MNLEIAKKYFSSWENKDIESLEELLSEDCILQDWEIKISGLDEIIKLNKKFFSENERSLDVVEIAEAENIIFAHLLIEVNEDKLEVVDKLEFKNNKIIKIHAFKC